jgi:hypothetical protein
VFDFAKRDLQRYGTPSDLQKANDRRRAGAPLSHQEAQG